MKEPGDRTLQKIGIVGPCTAGKSTLIKQLEGQYNVVLRHIAQEHSYVQNMWQRITQPNWLVFLDVTYPVTMQRKNLNWTQKEYQEQQRRLKHAREHADFYLLTDDFTPEQVAERVAAFIQEKGIQPIDASTG